MTLGQKYGMNSRTYLGIVQFALDFMKGAINPKYGVAPFQRDMLCAFMEDHPDWIKEDRMSVFAAFRESAKTTWFGVVAPTYFACLNGYIYWENYNLPPIDYVVIKSKTKSAAKKTFQRTQHALMSKLIVDVFGNKAPTVKEVRDKDGQNTSELMVTKNGEFILEALGINNPIRGTNILNKRPVFALYDDPESTENTKTPERRENNVKDLFAETIGAIDSNIGRLLFIGNMVHQDCLLANLLRTEGWKKKFYTLSYVGKDGQEKSTWEQRYPLPMIRKKYNFYKNQPKLGTKLFFQEYYNKIVSDTSPVFLRDTEWKYVRKDNINWINKGEEWRNLQISVGYDPAQSDKAWSSDSAIVAMGIDSLGKKYIIDYFLGKLDLHDKYSDNKTPVYPFALSNEDMTNVYKKGGIEEVLRFIVKYNADIFCVETASQQRGIFNDIRERLDRTTPDFLASKKVQGRTLRGVQGLTYTPHQDKIQKLASSVMREYEAGNILCITDKYHIENIVNQFPHTKLDLLDAQFLADLGLNNPLKVEYNPVGFYKRKDIHGIPQFSKDIEEAWIVS